MRHLFESTTMSDSAFKMFQLLLLHYLRIFCCCCLAKEFLQYCTVNTPIYRYYFLHCTVQRRSSQRIVYPSSALSA